MSFTIFVNEEKLLITKIILPNHNTLLTFYTKSGIHGTKNQTFRFLKSEEKKCTISRILIAVRPTPMLFTNCNTNKACLIMFNRRYY